MVTSAEGCFPSASAPHLRRERAAGVGGGKGREQETEEGRRLEGRGGGGVGEEDLSREGGKAFTQAWGERRSIA